MVAAQNPEPGYAHANQYSIFVEVYIYTYLCIEQVSDPKQNLVV